VRRGTLSRLVAVGLAAGAGAFIAAFFIPWLPDQASREREWIDLVFWVTSAICIFVFALVAGLSVYAIWKFRAAPDDDSDGPPIHGHTGLEIAWTAVPAVLVTGIAVVSAVALAKNDRFPDDSMVVRVTARQFAWSFSYPEFGDVSSATLRLPRGRPIQLELTSQDVIHSFWVPQFGQKQDVLPSPEVTKVKITPTRGGRFPLICTELCGAGHAFMRSWAEVMEPAAFERWARQQGRAVADGGTRGGAAIFREQGCGSCHTFRPAGTRASVGPNLDRLPQYARRAGRPLERFVRQSIVAPDEYVERGYRPNVMPKTYAQLPDREIDALVQYLTEPSSASASPTKAGERSKAGA
jgi:cytochrome c oxidase subunit II